MGQVLHGTATTTHATRAKIQASEEERQPASRTLPYQPQDGAEMATARSC